MNTTAKDIAARFTRAMTLPEIVLRFDDMLNDGVSNASDFSQLISRDPGLTATLLRFANSPLYGFSGKVATIDRAISLIGMRDIRDLVLAVSIRTTFDKIPTDIISMDDFWRHSLCCALASRRIAEMLRHSQRDVLFTSGLIHGIGQLAMLSEIPDVCVDVFLQAQRRDDVVEHYQLERELIGFDHHEVGAEIARAWRFPLMLQDTIKFHHVPDEAPRHQFECSIVNLGNAIAVMVVLEMDWFSKAPPISTSALEHIGLDQEQLQPIVLQVHAMFHEIRPVFGIAA